MLTQLLALTGRLRFHEAAVQGKLKCERGREKPWFHSATQEVYLCVVWNTTVSKSSFSTSKTRTIQVFKEFGGFCLCVLLRETVSV